MLRYKTDFWIATYGNCATLLTLAKAQTKAVLKKARLLSFRMFILKACYVPYTELQKSQHTKFNFSGVVFVMHRPFYIYLVPRRAPLFKSILQFWREFLVWLQSYKTVHAKLGRHIKWKKVALMKIKGIDVYCMSCIAILNLAYEGVDV